MASGESHCCSRSFCVGPSVAARGLHGAFVWIRKGRSALPAGGCGSYQDPCLGELDGARFQTFFPSVRCTRCLVLGGVGEKGGGGASMVEGVLKRRLSGWSAVSHHLTERLWGKSKSCQRPRPPGICFIDPLTSRCAPQALHPRHQAQFHRNGRGRLSASPGIPKAAGNVRWGFWYPSSLTVSWDLGPGKQQERVGAAEKVGAPACPWRSVSLRCEL